ncbi:hypothetical protein LTS18_006874 [Coniosporium uncinatum]|uniref:Uncharacterized protein n=1 Tax=Coniosporium uncinatum TaxID=93489 RepID=A0ACC3DXL9_9PEZI|nr:hypothetical protein LTS18_006874 [Coniosporium uncinatum]
MSTSAPTTSPSDSSTISSPRCRIRTLLPTLYLGRYPPGPKNSLTDVPGVLASTSSIHSAPSATPGSVNTGLTCILPRRDFFSKACFAGLFRFNGSGELTGSHWIEETGLLHSPIVLTNSFAVGAAYQGIYEYCVPRYKAEDDGEVDWFLLPVVGETFDGFLNDMSTFAVRSQDVVRGLEAVSGDAVEEGCTGGGTGMICHWFKGGTGSSSRVVMGESGGREKEFTVGALVQANYGAMRDFKMAGVPVGRLMVRAMEERLRENPDDAETLAEQMVLANLKQHKDKKDGSIIVIIATDAPLHPTQLQRLAKRATVGLAKVGGLGHNPSGDIFLAFSTGVEIPVQTVGAQHRSVNPWTPSTLSIEMIDDQTINALIEATADAVEESIYNAVCMAESMTGFKGRRIDALNLEKVKELMEKYGAAVMTETG